MALGSSTVWLDVTKTRLHSALMMRGVETATHSVPLTDGWEREELAAAVSTCLERIGAGRSRVNVFWRCDGSAATVVRTPVTGKPACDAAVLAEVESGSINPATQLIEAETLATTGEGSRVLVAQVGIERERMIREAVLEAGGRMGAIYAGESFAARAAVMQAERTSDQDPSVTLAMGDDASAIAIAVGGQTTLVRFADVGLSALASAYLTLLANTEDPPSDLDGAARRMLLEEHGVPGTGDEDYGGIRGVDVLRSMQPALQRIAVELKQSVRFTLEPSAQFQVRLHLVGPCEGVKRLRSVLAEQLEIELEGGAADESGAPNSPEWFSLVQRAGLDGRGGACAYADGTSESGVSVRAFWGGVAAAAVLVTGAGGLAMYESQTIQRELTATLEEVSRLGAAETSVDEHREAIASSALERALRASAASTADHGAALRLVAEAAGETVEIETLRADRTNNGTRLTLRVRSSGATVEDARASMQGYVDALDGSALTNGVDVGTVRMIEEPSTTYASFELSLLLHETVAAWIETGGAE